MESQKFNQIVEKLMVRRIETYTESYKQRLKNKPSEESQQLVLRPEPRPCRDCGDMVVERRVTFQKKWGYKDIPYWQKKCDTCRIRTPGLDIDNK
jgi:hypothetical protein